MFANNWFRSISTGKVNNKISMHKSRSIIAVAFNGNYRFSDENSEITQELRKIYSQRNNHLNDFGLISYSSNDKSNPYQVKNRSNVFSNNDNTPSSKHNESLMISQTLNTTEVLAGNVLLACTKPSSSQSPFTFTDPLRDITYTMVVDGDVDKNNLLMRLSGFVEWLDNNSPETLSSTNQEDLSYLFLWLIKSIQICNGDVLTGLHKGLSMLSKHNIGGHYNILFSDGSGIFAFSNTNKNSLQHNKMTYKISRNVHNICSYTIKNCDATPELGWTDLKEHNLYYFPIQGAMQVYANIDTNQYSDVKFKTGVNWVCLSLLSC